MSIVYPVNTKMSLPNRSILFDDNYYDQLSTHSIDTFEGPRFSYHQLVLLTIQSPSIINLVIWSIIHYIRLSPDTPADDLR